MPATEPLVSSGGIAVANGDHPEVEVAAVPADAPHDEPASTSKPVERR